jgi:hypothetical protein
MVNDRNYKQPNHGELRTPDSTYRYENPWDGSPVAIQKSRTKAVDFSNLSKLLLLYLTLLILTLLFLAGNIRAGQTTTPKKETKETKFVMKGKVDRDVKKAAEEYAYLLEQLLYLSSDYCRYFEKLDDKSADENYRALANMCARISNEERFENVNVIISEINELKKELAERERELARIQKELAKESGELKEAQSNLKALKLTTSLREELESIDDQLKNEVVWQVADWKNYEDAVNEYVKTLVNDSVLKVFHNIGNAYAPRVHVVHTDDGTEVTVVEVPDYSESQYGYVPEGIHPVPPVSPTPAVPGMFAGGAFHKEFKDSLQIKSADIGIYVTNAIGDVEISSWPQRQVAAVYTVSISSDKLLGSEKFDKEIHLRLYPKQNKVYIESVVPPLADPKMRIINSRLHLMVPVDNNLFISNTSGNVSVREIRNDVKVKGASCNIDLQGINGNAEVVNSSGTISVNRIKGNTLVQNRMGPIALTNCVGTIDVDNSFGAITISNCDGNAVIRNTGPITVAGHLGDVEITNRSGIVNVTNLEGDLAAFNSFEPLTVQNIKGAAKLINANASIEAAGVDGLLTISNRFAPVTVSAISGPINIENRSGDITMQLSKTMSGSSSVIANGGQIFLSVAPRTNLLVTMESLSGQIDLAGFDAQVEKKGEVGQFATLKVGNGSNSMAVKTNNSKVTVKPYQKLAQSADF